MIKYSNGGISGCLKVFWMTGSVFPWAFFVACPCACWSAALKALNEAGYLPDMEAAINNGAWNGFSILMGFLIVFRTSQSYTRFWDGCSTTKKMGAEWFASCSALISFCKYSDCTEAETQDFQSCIIRLFSMLHAAAWGSIEDNMSTNSADLEAFKFELVDAGGIDEESLLYLADETLKVELLYQWIQNLIVVSMKKGILSIPPPVLSRAFQELSTGMVAFHDAKKIAHTPFPFPYAQMCEVLLYAHWIMVPFVVYYWVNSAFWAAALTFVQVFVLWALNFIAQELENPYGTDANDLDGRHLQSQYNSMFTLLLRPHAKGVPNLKDSAVDYHQWQDDDQAVEVVASLSQVLQTAEQQYQKEATMEQTVSLGGKDRLKSRAATMKFQATIERMSSSSTLSRRMSIRPSMPSPSMAVPKKHKDPFQASLALDDLERFRKSSKESSDGVSIRKTTQEDDLERSRKPSKETSDDDSISKASKEKSDECEKMKSALDDTCCSGRKETLGVELLEPDMDETCLPIRSSDYQLMMMPPVQHGEL